MASNSKMRNRYQEMKSLLQETVELMEAQTAEIGKLRHQKSILLKAFKDRTERLNLCEKLIHDDVQRGNEQSHKITNLFQENKNLKEQIEKVHQAHRKIQDSLDSRIVYLENENQFLREENKQAILDANKIQLQMKEQLHNCSTNFDIFVDSSRKAMEELESALDSKDGEIERTKTERDFLSDCNKLLNSRLEDCETRFRNVVVFGNIDHPFREYIKKYEGEEASSSFTSKPFKPEIEIVTNRPEDTHQMDSLLYAFASQPPTKPVLNWHRLVSSIPIVKETKKELWETSYPKIEYPEKIEPVTETETTPEPTEEVKVFTADGTWHNPLTPTRIDTALQILAELIYNCKSNKKTRKLNQVQNVLKALAEGTPVQQNSPKSVSIVMIGGGGGGAGRKSVPTGNVVVPGDSSTETVEAPVRSTESQIEASEEQVLSPEDREFWRQERIKRDNHRVDSYFERIRKMIHEANQKNQKITLFSVSDYIYRLFEEYMKREGKYNDPENTQGMKIYGVPVHEEKRLGLEEIVPTIR